MGQEILTSKMTCIAKETLISYTTFRRDCSLLEGTQPVDGKTKLQGSS